MSKIEHYKRDGHIHIFFPMFVFFSNKFFLLILCVRFLKMRFQKKNYLLDFTHVSISLLS